MRYVVLDTDVELRELLTEYGVGEQEQSTLAAITQAGGRGAWRHYGNAIPGPYREYLVLEQAASDIFIYDPQHIPDLLQTPEYTRASVTGSPPFPADPELALSRQQVLSEQRSRLTALIGEAALRQPNGDTEVMRNQLTALTASGKRVVVQVLPSTCRLPSSGPATILRIAEIPDLGAVYLPGLSGGICLVGQQDVASYTRAFEHLRASALSPAASAHLICEIARG